MPVKKTPPTKKASQELFQIEKRFITSHCHDVKSIFYGSDFARKIFLTLFGIFIVYLIFLLGTMIRNNIEQYYHIGFADRQERTITLDAQAKVTANPDIAITNIGMLADGATVVEAQEKNTTVMNKLITKLGEMGINKEDIQTNNYDIYPQYNYTEVDGRVLEGYEVSQSVEIKIRDLDKANDILALAGEIGVNSVSGLQFTIDDREVYRTEARNQALQKVYQKARELSHSLGVELVSVVSYNEYEVGGDLGNQPIMDRTYSVGGGTPPEIEAGSMDILMNVGVTFEIR
ncbi:MAG: hypothetical protein COX81_00165 [Candidatus Magasanikbacteria bacterium CG_4_10_14_0_2_um_filter_37_12]|uniref:SIMPL domain-containing protein n=1 Tax=Candidatus Magasanikbacteria bacterium CG_4_10_14_0_2_um_filter_37_12 TaxID=1974637 RepID=A0A2M7VAI1_9BACT|nr:MAG: hypothetical protein COX81_00165 [Candidatus Magasanikbacteria bacterium CG_4_10_14_0_2_um_filter_37_12]